MAPRAARARWPPYQADGPASNGAQAHLLVVLGTLLERLIVTRGLMVRRRRADGPRAGLGPRDRQEPARGVVGGLSAPTPLSARSADCTRACGKARPAPAQRRGRPRRAHIARLMALRTPRLLIYGTDDAIASRRVGVRPGAVGGAAVVVAGERIRRWRAPRIRGAPRATMPGMYPCRRRRPSARSSARPVGRLSSAPFPGVVMGAPDLRVAALPEGPQACPVRVALPGKRPGPDRRGAGAHASPCPLPARPLAGRRPGAPAHLEAARRTLHRGWRPRSVGGSRAWTC